ncbi:MAG: hypothetical protein H7282_07225 [Cytophagaceae bacterium]|nr:hypothetical protein [Cytophagaceae bacterium]
MYSPLIFSQNQLIDTTIVEEFDNNLNEWSEWQSDENGATLTNGNYNVENKTTEGRAYWQTFQVDLKSDYSIEMKLTQTAGTDNNGYGLIWGFEDWNNYNSFLITPNKYFYIGSSEAGTANEIQPDITNNNVKGIGEVNIIKIDWMIPGKNGRYRKTWDQK